LPYDTRYWYFTKVDRGGGFYAGMIHRITQLNRMFFFETKKGGNNYSRTKLKEISLPGGASVVYEKVQLDNQQNDAGAFFMLLLNDGKILFYSMTTDGGGNTEYFRTY